MAIQKEVNKDLSGSPTSINFIFGGNGRSGESRITMKYMEAIDIEAEKVFEVSLDTLDKAMTQAMAISNDRMLSEIGKANKTRPIFEDLILTLSGSWFMLDNFEQRVMKREAALNSVPTLEPTHSAMAVEDMEIRNWWRAQPIADRLRMIDRFDDSDKSKRIMIALIRSPIALVDSEAKTVSDKWQDNRRAENPTEAGFIDVANASIDWARRGVAEVAGMARIFMRLNNQDILKTIVTSPAEGRRLGYKVFGFTDRQVAEMNRYLEIIAAKKAA